MGLKSCLFILFFIFSFLGFSQQAEIRGFLYEKSTGEPLIFSNIYLKGTTIGASSDVNGFYSITRIPPGNYQLVVTSIGYDTITENISLKEGQIISKNFQLSEGAITLKTIEVKGDKIDRVTNVNVGITKVTPREINILPSIGGEPDLAQYIQTLPGVVFTGDQGGKLYIRGGSPVQNLALIDGMVIYNPFHSIGLFSVFDTDIIRSVDIFTGGFKADYGGRTSAVIDIKTRDGNKKKLSGKLSANPFTSKVLFEGPIKKQKDSGGSTSFLFTHRNSYLDKSSKVLYSYANDKEELPFSFNDTYGKVTMQAESGSKISVFGFNFNDKATIDSLNQISWGNIGLGSSFILLPSTSSTVVTGYLGYSDYEINISEESIQPRTSDVSVFNFGLDFNYFPGKNEVKYGVEIQNNTTSFTSYYPTGELFEGEPKNNTELSGFFRYKIVKTRFVFEPSVRLHYYASLSKIRFEPRLGAKYNLTDQIRLKFAGGYFSQNLIATRSDRDIVNLFAGYISSPDADKVNNYKGERVDNRLQTSRHIILGFEYDFFTYFEFDFEPYIKYFDQLITINRSTLVNSMLITESGIARGIDVQLKYDFNNVLVQFGYSLGQVTRKGLIDDSGEEKEYPTNYDRRHNVNLLSSYKFGKNGSYEVSLRWNFGSGFPFTPTVGFYEDHSYSGNIGGNISNDNGELGILYGTLNSSRLPVYHRLDLSIKKLIKLNNNNEIEINGGIINVYNRQNIFYMDRVTSKIVNQLPILPSLGLSWKF